MSWCCCCDVDTKPANINNPSPPSPSRSSNIPHSPSHVFTPPPLTFSSASSIDLQDRSVQVVNSSSTTNSKPPSSAPNFAEQTKREIAANFKKLEQHVSHNFDKQVKKATQEAFVEYGFK